MRERERERGDIYPTSNDNTSNNRDESDVCEPTLPLEGHDISKDSGEKGGGGTNGLVEGDREVAEGDVASNHRQAEYESKR